MAEKETKFEDYATHYDAEAVDFLTEGGPLRSTNTEGGEGLPTDPLSVPPTTADIWEEWKEEDEQNFREFDERVARQLAAGALVLASFDAFLTHD
jgi:hypothetical protein